jgi:hypothetical protein
MVTEEVTDCEDHMKDDISGSHGSKCEDGCLLGCCVVQPGRSLPTLEMFLLSLSSGVIPLLMKAANTTETSVNFYQTTRHNNPIDSHLHTKDNFVAK